VRDFKVPGSDFIIPAGMLVQLPTLAIMRDEKYFGPNPLKFNPENFSAEAKANRPACAFLSFGQGPRNCVGMRFAMLAMRVAAVRLVRDFNLEPCAKTVDTLIADPRSPTNQPIGGIWLKITQRHR